MSYVALVTGANRGIGFEICRQLGARGITVLMGARNPEAGEQAADELRREGVKALFVKLDCLKREDIESVSDFVHSQYGALDILVNNAAIYPDEGVSVFDLDVDLLRKTLEVNTIAPFLLCQEFIPKMRERDYGRVVNVSSGAGAMMDMMGYTAAYRISKAALNALTRIFAAEVRGYNIKINAMCPGWVRTRMGGSRAPRSVEQGADTAVWLATLPEDGPSSGFFRDRKPIPW